MTARGPRCVRVTRAALSLCVVWVCGLQLTGREEDGRALCVCLLYPESGPGSLCSRGPCRERKRGKKSSAFCHSTALLCRINTRCHHSDVPRLKISPPFSFFSPPSPFSFIHGHLGGPERPFSRTSRGLCLTLLDWTQRGFVPHLKVASNADNNPRN